MFTKLNRFSIHEKYLIKIGININYWKTILTLKTSFNAAEYQISIKTILSGAPQTATQM